MAARLKFSGLGDGHYRRVEAVTGAPLLFTPGSRGSLIDAPPPWQAPPAQMLNASHLSLNDTNVCIRNPAPGELKPRRGEVLDLGLVRLVGLADICA